MKVYDLENRTLRFSTDILNTCKSLPKSVINNNLIDQLVRSATSVGANYREANETDSKKDFRNKIRISKKEAKETIYWLELINSSNPNFSTQLEKLHDESVQLMKILSSIYSQTI